jgi:hypothetical protein
MNVQAKLNKAVREHAPVADLRAILRSEVTGKLAAENETIDAVELDVDAIERSVESLLNRTGHDEDAVLAARRRYETIKRAAERLSRFAEVLRS